MVRCYRLKSGEDVITTVEEKMGRSGLIFVKPSQIVLHATQTGFNVGLAPFLPFAEGHRIDVPNDSIMFSFEPTTQLANEYIRITSGIQIANSLPPEGERPKLSLV